MMKYLGMALKRIGSLAVSVREMNTLTVKMETVTPTGKGRYNLTYFVYRVYEIDSKIVYLSRRFTFGGSPSIRVVLHSGKYGNTNMR